MEHVETEGDSVDEAIEKALNVLGLERDQVELEVVAEGRKGLFGFGAKRACIRATVRRPLRAAEEKGAGEQERMAVGQRGRVW